MAMCGGIGEIKDADEDVQGLCEMVRVFLEQKVAKTFSEFTAKQYVSQVVAGTNYFVKVHVGGEEYFHVKIFKPLPHVNGIPKLSGYQENKSLGDAMEFF